MRSSQIITEHDDAGPYEIERFDAPQPESVIICAHGKGVRRWDGAHFFYNVADHYTDDAVWLVDQNQPFEDGCKMNSLPVMVARVQSLIALAQQEYPGVPIVVIGHSMGCGVAAGLDVSGVAKVIFVAPTAGAETAKLLGYGPGIVNGMVVKSSDGLTKDISKEYVDSVKGIIWEDEYRKLLERYKSVYVFESGDEEIFGDARLAHRDMPFAGYRIIPGAKHNYSGQALQDLFAELDSLL